MSRLRLVLASTSIVMLQPACATVPPAYHVSAPEALPGIAGKIQDSGRAVLYLEQLDVALLALDAAATSPKGAMLPLIGASIPRLMIRLEFKPRVAGYSFNPTRVNVRTSEGAVVHPRAYMGPGEVVSWREGGTGSATLRACRQPPSGFWHKRFGEWAELPEHTESTFFPVRPNGSCFVISFPTTVELGSRVELTIAGIVIGSQSMEVPTLRLSRRAGRSQVFEMNR